MRKRLKGAAVLAALALFAVGAFAAGRAGSRLVRRDEGRARDLALYASLVRFAGRSPLTVTSGGLSKQSDLRPLNVFGNVEQRLRANYYKKIEDNRTLAFGTADGMVDSLGDPYSRFFEPDQLKSYIDRQAGIYSGIGAILGVRRVPLKTADELTQDERDQAVEDRNAMPAYDDPVDSDCVERNSDGNPVARFDVVITSVVPGGPAEGAGLRPGDVIHKVNGKLVFARNLDSLEEMLLVPTQGEVKISVLRKGVHKQIEATVPFRVTRIQPVVESRGADGAGVITIRTLGPGTADAVRTQVRSLLAARVPGIVLDLRKDGDGDFKEACRVASIFLSEGSVATVKAQGGKYAPVSVEPGLFVGKVAHVAVLVDETTSGPAELVAGALQARGVAKVVGQVTSGHAQRQELYRMPGDSGILLTTGLFYEPVAGAPGTTGVVDGKGITPDVVVAPKEGAGDVALQRALTWIKDGAA